MQLKGSKKTNNKMMVNIHFALNIFHQQFTNLKKGQVGFIGELSTSNYLLVISTKFSLVHEMCAVCMWLIHNIFCTHLWHDNYIAVIQSLLDINDNKIRNLYAIKSQKERADDSNDVSHLSISQL